MYNPSPETLEFISKHLQEDVRTLALKLRKYPLVDGVFALQQIAGYKVMKEKVPSWAENCEIRYPKQLSLEQCSSEATALYKASLVDGDKMADLTGGFGIDCAFLARKFKAASYIERNEELCQLATVNFPALGLDHVRILHAESTAIIDSLDNVDLIFIDPARRDAHGGKIIAVADCEPNVAELASILLSKANKVMVKLSPMLDISQAISELPQTAEVHVISVNNECKELLLFLENRSVESIPIHTINLTKNETQRFLFTKHEEQEASCSYTKGVEQYLYEPNASILKAGAYKMIAERFGLKKLHVNSHLYTSHHHIDEFPGRIFRVESTFSLNKEEVKVHLSETKKANITVRNFPLTVAELRKRLKLQEGGEDYLFATTLSDERKVLIKCRKV